MKGNIKATQKLILTYMEKIDKSGENRKLYEDMFKSMSDKDFDTFMSKLKSGEKHLEIIVPSWSNVKVTPENNFKVAEELGVNFFTKVTFKGDANNPPYTPNHKYLVYDITWRRTSQLLTKKISIPEDSRSVDLATGQVTGKSRGSKLTMPEIQLLAGMGLKDSVVELLKYRGGDVGGWNAFSKLLYKQGSVDMDVVKEYATGVVSVRTLKNYFLAMMIKSTL